jgi:hypothetical protein
MLLKRRYRPCKYSYMMIQQVFPCLAVFFSSIVYSNHIGALCIVLERIVLCIAARCFPLVLALALVMMVTA